MKKRQYIILFFALFYMAFSILVANDASDLRNMINELTLNHKWEHYRSGNMDIQFDATAIEISVYNSKWYHLRKIKP